MRRFYEATAGVAHLEQLVELSGPASPSVKFKLRPIGVSRPVPTAPAELSRFVKHVLFALRDVALRGWAVVDVRVDNIVLSSQGGYVLIDAAEHATEHDKPLPTNINVAQALLQPGKLADKHTDMHQLHAMLYPVASFISLTRQGASFWKRLQSPQNVTAEELIQHSYLKHVI